MINILVFIFITFKSGSDVFSRDRKRKKFITESGEGKAKKIKTESGNWIPASYKSNLYPFVFCYKIQELIGISSILSIFRFEHLGNSLR